MQHNKEIGIRIAVALATGLMIALTSVAAEAQFFPVYRVIGFNVRLAGHDLNGVNLNGTIMDGQRIQTISTVDVELDGDLMEAVWLKDSYLVGVDARGRSISRNRMVGAVFAATLENGESVSLRIDELRRHEEHENHKGRLATISL